LNVVTTPRSSCTSASASCRCGTSSATISRDLRS
jgi:hypothetical protein